MGATSPLSYAKELNFWGDWQWRGWQVEKYWIVPTSKALRKQEPFGKKRNLNHKWDWANGMILLHLLPRSLWCEVTSPHSPTAHPQILYFQVISRFHFVLDLVDFFRHIETSSTNHSVTSMLGWSCRLRLSEILLYLLPSVNHDVVRARCWPLRPDDVKSGTIWSSILACSAVNDDISHVKSWLSESHLSSKILLRPHRKNKQNVLALSSWHTLLGRENLNTLFIQDTTHLFWPPYMIHIGVGRQTSLSLLFLGRPHRGGRGESRVGPPS